MEPSSKKIDYIYFYMQVDFHIQQIRKNEDFKTIGVRLHQTRADPALSEKSQKKSPC